MSFYYWRTAFGLDSTETNALEKNAVHTLYIRYFDVDWPDTSSAPAPVTPVHFATLPSGFTIIPVIFLRNRVFGKLDSSTLPAFASKILALVRHINASVHQEPAEIQFDCDWTERTKENYFRFLQQYHSLSGSILSATIRLHQVKFADRTGVPPVDHGVLMFYNMGNIDAGTGNSIYDRSIAHRYTPSLRTYPLTLDLALPIFSWGLQVRDGKVIGLLDKMNSTLFEKDTNFSRQTPQYYTASHACFKNGYYFRDGDAVKLESTSAADLLEMVGEVNLHSNHRIRNLIFFDLDRQTFCDMTKAFLRKSWIILISACFVSTAIALACAGDWDPEYGASNFTPEIFVDSTYSPFFYSNLFYYGINYDDTHLTRWNTRNIQDWTTWLGKTARPEEVGFLLDTANITTIGQALDWMNGKRPVSPLPYCHLLTDKKDKKITAFLLYLHLAKKCEAFSLTPIRYAWEQDSTAAKKPPFNAGTLDKQLQQELSAAVDIFLQERYWFQLIRSHFFNGTPRESIRLFETYSPKFPRDKLWYRSLAYTAGAWYRLKNYSRANYYYSRVFDSCEELRMVAHYSFHPQEEADWTATLALCHTKE